VSHGYPRIGQTERYLARGDVQYLKEGLSSWIPGASLIETLARKFCVLKLIREVLLREPHEAR
jgi:hypothetical protein